MGDRGEEKGHLGHGGELPSNGRQSRHKACSSVVSNIFNYAPA